MKAVAAIAVAARLAPAAAGVATPLLKRVKRTLRPAPEVAKPAVAAEPVASKNVSLAGKQTQVAAVAGAAVEDAIGPSADQSGQSAVGAKATSS